MISMGMMNVLTTFAIKEDKFIDIYKKYEDYFSKFDVVHDILRSLGWMILKGMIKITSLMNLALDKIFDFINFLESDEIIQFFNSVKPFIWTVFLFALVYLGYCYLYAHEKPKGVVTNLMIFMGTVMILPYMMVQMNQIVTYGKEALAMTSDDSGYELLIPYITDLVYLDTIDFDDEKIKNGQLNGFNAENCENIKYLYINDVVDPSEFNLKNKELFKKQLSSTIKKGTDTLEVIKIKKNKILFKDATPYYYRYHVNFFIAFIYLLALVLVLGFSSFKLVSLIYELAAEKIIAPFIAAGDLTGGQKIRKALIGILNAYITILCVLFLQKLFILSTEYINTRTWAENAAGNGFIKTILIIAGALFVIDGPNFFEQIFGVDAGLKSVGQALQSAYYGSQMLGGAVRGASGLARKAGGAVKGAAGKAAGALGALSGMKDTGIFDTNNRRVSQDMASMYFGEVELDPSHALGDGSENLEPNGSELPGGGQPTLPGGNQNLGGSMKNKPNSPDTPGSSGQKRDSGVKGGDGKQNLNNMAGKEKGADTNADVNGAINDALNNMSQGSDSSQGLSANGEVKENENLSGWVARNAKNSAAGQYLKDNYDKGKSLGHAVGNSMNERNRKKAEQGQNIPGQNKDNLKQ